MTKVCEYCGKEFDVGEACDEFEMETLKRYDYLTKCLCAECAIEAINDRDSGIYCEVCENCGSRFDPFVDELEFERQTGDSGVEIGMFGKSLCLDCSLDEYRNRFEDDEDDSESLSVYDAALIWASHGKDEDYTFGYSEEELENAL